MEADDDLKIQNHGEKPSQVGLDQCQSTLLWLLSHFQSVPDSKWVALPPRPVCTRGVPVWLREDWKKSEFYFQWHFTVSEPSTFSEERRKGV